ncbi:MAG: 3-hydroxybutyrate dehydrogenase [Bdellovibrionales bacterium]
MSLKGKIAVVTGSTSGIGLGIARALAQQGASVMLNGLMDPKSGEAFRAQFESEFKTPTTFSAADMSKPSEIRSWLADLQKQFGRLDILVNNAGIQHVAPVEDFPEEKWNAVLAINLSSAFHTIQACLPGMKKQNWGRIINVASVHGLVASAQKSAYVAAKHGLIGLTKAVALETATTGITCNAICPGWVLTPLVQAQIDQLAKSQNLDPEQAKTRLLSEKQPSQNFVTPEQIGESVLFLCSGAATQIRGTTLTLDGGWLAQ